METLQGGSTFPPQSPPNERPTSTIFTSTNMNTNIPEMPEMPTSISIDGDTSLSPHSTNTPQSDRPTNPSDTPVPPTYTGTNPTTNDNEYTNTINGGKYPVTEKYPVRGEHYPNTNGNSYGTHNEMYPTDQNRPMNPTSDSGSSYPTDAITYPPHYQNKYNYYQEIYPTYGHPVMYETNYPMPNSGGQQNPTYAQNFPSVDNGYANERPATTYHGSTQHTTGLDVSRPQQPPTSSYNGVTATGSSTYMGNGYSNADEINRNRPTSTNGYRGNQSSLAPVPTNPQHGYGNKQPEGNYVTEKTIRTYFNPDEYYPNFKRE